MAYGPRLGGLTVVAYLFEGALGLPVFAASGYGFSVLLGPTAGYLFGFIIAAIADGFLSHAFCIASALFATSSKPSSNDK